MLLYTPIYGAKTPVGPYTAAILKSGGKGPSASGPLAVSVVSVTDGAGSVPIPADSCVLIGTGDAAAWMKANLHPGEAATLSVALEDGPRRWNDVAEAVAGGPLLLRDGHESIDLLGAKMSESFSTTRHPRTAVGVRANGDILLVVVDGRQSLSRGMSLRELAACMKDLGARDAVNLDGGGSTTLVIKDPLTGVFSVANRPSGVAVGLPGLPAERPVVDVLGVVLRDLPTERPREGSLRH